LRVLPDSFRELSSPIAVPGQVEFSPSGRLLLVPHKTTNTLLTPANAIDVFRVDSTGYATAVPRRNASNGLRPFSLAFRNNSQLLVVEAFNAAEAASAVSSYRVLPNGNFNVISGSVPNQQTDACWVVITDDGRYAYIANFGSGTIWSLRVSGGEARDERKEPITVEALSSFGEDARGELYAVSLSGTIYRIAG
jgi:6-phosphogluconolactonase (cycloisomerase 2 family)